MELQIGPLVISTRRLVSFDDLAKILKAANGPTLKQLFGDAKTSGLATRAEAEKAMTAAQEAMAAAQRKMSAAQTMGEEADEILQIVDKYVI